MASKGYITIPDWMNDLDIDVYETIILATIYGFSQDGDSRFSGSQNYLARKAKCSRRKVIKCLENLIGRGLIKKFDLYRGGVHFCEYTYINQESAYQGCEQGSQGVNEMHRGCEQDSHNNKEDNKDNKIYNESRSSFVKPTLQEIAEYCKQRGNNVNPETFYNHYESNGWMVGKNRMKNWKAAIHTWENSDRERRASGSGKPFSSRKESVFEQNLKMVDQMFGTNMHSQAYGNKEVADEQ